MEDDRVAILEAQLAQAKLIAEEADKKYEEVFILVQMDMIFPWRMKCISGKERQKIESVNSWRLFKKFRFLLPVFIPRVLQKGGQPIDWRHRHQRGI